MLGLNLTSSFLLLPIQLTLRSFGKLQIPIANAQQPNIFQKTKKKLNEKIFHALSSQNDGCYFVLLISKYRNKKKKPKMMQIIINIIIVFVYLCLSQSRSKLFSFFLLLFLCIHIQCWIHANKSQIQVFSFLSQILYRVVKGIKFKEKAINL